MLRCPRSHSAPPLFPPTGAELVAGGPRQGHLREERAAGEVLPRGEGQGRGPEGAESGLQGHRDGPGGTGRGPQGEDGGHHSKGSAAARVLPGQTGNTRHCAKSKVRRIMKSRGHPESCQLVDYSVSALSGFMSHLCLPTPTGHMTFNPKDVEVNHLKVTHLYSLHSHACFIFVLHQHLANPTWDYKTAGIKEF